MAQKTTLPFMQKVVSQTNLRNDKGEIIKKGTPGVITITSEKSIYDVYGVLFDSGDEIKEIPVYDSPYAPVAPVKG